jgi:hypothetical protein
LEKGFLVSEDGRLLLFQYERPATEKKAEHSEALVSLLGADFLNRTLGKEKQIIVLGRYVEVLHKSVLADGFEPLLYCQLPATSNSKGKIFCLEEEILSDNKRLMAFLLQKSCDILPNKQTSMLLQIYFRELSNQARTSVRSNVYGWSEDGKFFCLPHGYMARKQGSLYCCGVAHVPELEAVSPSQLKAWQDNVAQYALQNARGVLALGCAFAAPLLKMLDWQTGFGVHFYGESSSGKTLLQKIANTVFRSSNAKKIPTWNTTRTAIDEMLAQSNDIPIIFDDIADQALDPKVVYQTMYGIPAGRSRSKCNSQSQLQAVHEWRTILVSSGEKDISTFLAGAKIEVQAGQLVRVLNIDCRDIYKAFDTIPEEFGSPEEFADHLETQVGLSEHYGVAGQAYIESLLRCEVNADRLQIKFAEHCKEINSWLLNGKKSESSQAHRALKNVSLMLFGLRLAYEYWIISTPLKQLLTSSLKKVIADYLDSIGDRSYERMNIATNFANRLRANEYKRFLYYTDVQTTQTLWGYRDDEYYYIFTDAMKNELLRGQDLKCALIEFHQRGWLVADPATSGRYTVLERFNKKPVRVYKVSMEALDA